MDIAEILHHASKWLTSNSSHIISGLFVNVLNVILIFFMNRYCSTTVVTGVKQIARANCKCKPIEEDIDWGIKMIRN